MVCDPPWNVFAVHMDVPVFWKKTGSMLGLRCCRALYLRSDSIMPGKRKKVKQFFDNDLQIEL
jgi:hypothetical protein